MMKKITLTQDVSEIYLDDVDKSTLIFAIRDDKIQGVLVKQDEGWIIKIGGIWGSNGFYPTRKQALDASYKKYFDYYAINPEIKE